MDIECSEWRNSTKISALPLFAPQEPPTSINRTTTTNYGMGSLFSLAQWQELELQALIYKHIMAGASVPLDLILLLKRIPLTSSFPSYCQHYYPHHFQQPSMMQTGYWGRCVVDAEPGRCRRTDGKKWRCSRDVVAGQKYCERHVHRGRNRSRKHVEVIPTPAAAPLREKKEILPRCDPQQQTERSDSRVLMRFFDDWPRRSQEDRDVKGDNIHDTHLSISIPDHKYSSASSSDFSLKLSTGGSDVIDQGREQPVLGSCSWLGWGSSHVEASMGAPLAEALRLSTAAAPSPTSVLHKPNIAYFSETSSASV